MSKTQRKMVHCLSLFPIKTRQIVRSIHFALSPLHLPQISSESFQTLPFCNTERGLQGHTLLPAATPTPPQPYLPSCHPLPSLFQAKSENLWSQVRRETVNKNCTFRDFENQTRTDHENTEKYYCTRY